MAAIVGQWIEGTNAIVRQLMYCTYAIGGQLIDCTYNEINVPELSAFSFNMRIEAGRGGTCKFYPV